MKNELNIGIIGAGGFAAFAVKAFLAVPGVRITAIADINEVAASAMANELNIPAFTNYEDLLKEKNIELVYIATPPWLHFEQSKQSLLSGKHVICEKPASLRLVEVDELVLLARSRQLLYVVNLMQRYNPLYDNVKRIIDENFLGNFLRGYFENYASDENLRPGHWFWDETKSGGIFIEHGVHFFDMFAGWFGNGEVVQAIQMQRPGVEKRLIDRVQASVVYQNGLVNFYHGFDQPIILDRQELRLEFEKGDIRLYGWIPGKMTLEGLLEKSESKILEEANGKLVFLETGNAGSKHARGRFTEINYDDHVQIDYTDPLGKQERYREMLTAMLADQWAWIRDPQHTRKITGFNAVESIRMAENANAISKYYKLPKTCN